MEATRHPLDPQSNIRKVGVYDPNKYFLGIVTQTVKTHEDLTPGKPPYITQFSIGKYLKPGTRELDEVPPRPTINELPDAVLENMVTRDKAFWVDKPGANAYTLHDAYYNYEMTTVMVKPKPSTRCMIDAGILDTDVGARFDQQLAGIDPQRTIGMGPKAHQQLRPEMMIIREELRQAKMQTLANELIYVTRSL